tara:strand:- start:7471 stop:8694 length:1224 start_codon:yes stop_codon:yes gene_type:complete
MGLKNKILRNSFLAGIVLLGTSFTHAEVIFSDSFDDQPDWNSGLPENDRGQLDMGGSYRGGWDVDIVQTATQHTIPNGWDFVRQTPSWSPSMGDPDRHETIEVSSTSTAENPNRARGGTGKSFIKWRDSDISKGENSWQSDGILVKYFPDGYSQLYMEFWINFSNETLATWSNPDYKTATVGQAKLFRFYYWNGISAAFDYYSDKYPAVTWDYEGRSVSQSGYGVRNATLISTKRSDRNDPTQSKRLDKNGNPTNDFSTSYHPKTTLRQGGEVLVDQRTGKPMDPGQFAIEFDQVFGDETRWTKVAFFAKMNSAPGKYDGVYKQWIDDKLIVDFDTMQWVAAGNPMVGWNVVALGGNDNFNKYPNDQRVEEWWAIDDLKVSTEIPDYLIGDLKSAAPPNPPLNITLE